MSRFSTIDSHHSALRDLERQRLERMMGQLRREVEGKAAAGSGGAGGGAVKEEGRGAGATRFQPRRRSGLAAAARCGAPLPPRAASAAAAAAPPEGGADAACPPAPGDDEPRAGGGYGPERVVASAPPTGSAELAWLWRASERLSEDAEEVRAFLVAQGLDRYAPLLLGSPDGLGASLEALREADGEDLERLGLPASPRQRLLEAIQEPLPPPRPGSSRGVVAASRRLTPQPPSRPGTGGSIGSRSGVASPAPPGEDRPWGRLGRMPSGWHANARPTSSSGGGVVIHRPVLVDSAVGDSEPLPPEAFEDFTPFAVEAAAAAAAAAQDAARPTPSASSSSSAAAAARPPAVTPLAAGAVAAAVSGRRSEAPTPAASRPTSAVGAAAHSFAAGPRSRPGTGSSAALAGSRPGTSGGEKVCCYQCFRQVYLQQALHVEEGGGVERLVCSKACADAFREALAVSAARAHELSQLRSAVLEAEAEGDTDEGAAPAVAAVAGV